MSFVKSLLTVRNLFRGETRSTNARFDSAGGGLSPYQGSRLMMHMSVDKAMRFTAVYAAIRLRSNTIASLPKSVYDLTGRGRSVADQHPVFPLLKYRPNGFQNAFSFWNFINTCVDGWGNGFVIIRRGQGAAPVELIPVHPQNVVLVFRNAKKWYKVGGTRDFDGLYSDEDMLHFYFYSVDGIQGVNPIVYNASSIASGVGAQDFGNEFFESKGNIRAVIETDERIGKETTQKFLENFEESKKYGNPILTHGFKWKTITISPEAAQMLETRTYALQDICRIFQLPPHLLADLSRSTFSNIEHQDIEFVKHCIRPTVKMYEQELDRKLFFDDERGKLEIKMNMEGLLRGDIATRMAMYQSAIQSGWMSRNEARENENLNPVDGLDEFLYPGNENVVGKEQPSTNK